MSLRYSELHKGKLFLSNRDQIKVSDVFDEINKADDENVLYDYFKSKVYISEIDNHYILNIYKYIKDKYLHVDKSESEELEFIVSKLKSTIESIELEDNELDKWRLDKISNLVEHIELEQLRICEQNRYYHSNLEIKDSLYREILQIDNKSNEAINNLENHKIDISKNIDGKVYEINKELDESKKSIYKEILSIVSIFTALSFGVFGGISILNNVFGNIGKSNVRLTDIIILGCITSICTLTLLYIFIDYLSRMTKLSISLNENKDSFYKDNKVLVYSYIVLGTILLITSIVILINNHRESWDLFIEYINLLLKSKISKLS